MLAYQRLAVPSRERRSSASWTHTPSPRSISSSRWETAPMSANGCQNFDVAGVGGAAIPGRYPRPRCPERPKSGKERFRSGEPGAQRSGHLVDGPVREPGGREPAPEAVDRPVVAPQLNLDAGVAEGLGVGLALVAQRVEPRGQHER